MVKIFNIIVTPGILLVSASKGILKVKNDNMNLFRILHGIN